MAKALKRINEGGADETINWFAKDIKDTDNIDVAQGIILFEQYQNDGNYNMAVKVVDRLAEIGTRAGQQVQMFALLRRMTPEGMNIYAKRTLQKAFDEAVKGKTKSWIEANQEKFQLTPEDAQFIQNNMEQVTQLEDGRQKDVLLAQIASRIQNKLPPVKGDGLKAYMRISMLLNPKTLLRNVVGNAVIAPVNAVADTFGTGADMLLSKKTGVRTTNLPQLKAIKKGFVEGGAKTINDFVQGINTNRMGNRFEIGKGKSFNENTKSKMLNNFNNKMNALDKVLGTALELGDRPFYEAAFLNSIEGQMKANNVDIPTNDMIDIATTEALERTWQDSNEYTKTVLNIRNALNVVNVKGYGLGDVLIPFAKTPANITKAIVEYSPVNAIKTILEYNGINKALETGQFTPQMQKKFVTDLGKTMSGTLLYILAYGLSQAGVISGGANEDKDVANYERNILGIQPYSFKIGDKSFTYDWMQPVATPFAIMADVVKDENKGVFNTLGKAFKIGGDVLLEQSFLTSFKNLFGYDGIASGLLENVADLPARAVPTLFKQIAEVIDPIARKSYVYNDLKQSMFNKVKAKLPGLSKTLEPVVDTFGNEVKRGSDNGIVRGLNTFLNPSNVAKQNTSKEVNEIYRLYKETGDKTIFPREAPNYVTYKNEKIIFTPEQKTTFQKTSGKYVKDTLSEITDNSAYKKLSDEEKAKVINQIVTDSYTLGEGSVGVVTENYEKLQGKMTELENIPVSSYYLAYFAQKDVEGLKDTNGKTIALTASKIKKQRIDEATPNLNNFDRIKLYKIFDISSKVW
jgi:hypothetical protein